MIEVPNAYAELTLDERPAILKLHGQVDRRPQRDRESFVVSEDDYIGYLAPGRDRERRPGYARGASSAAATSSSSATRSTSGTCACSSTASGATSRPAYRSWAIQPNPGALTRQFWRHRDVDIFDLPLADTSSARRDAARRRSEAAA